MAMLKTRKQLSKDNGYTIDANGYGGMVHHFFPLDEATNALQAEVISGDRNEWGGAATHTNNGNGTSTGQLFTTAPPLYDWKDESGGFIPSIDNTKSFISFMLHTTPASGQVLRHGAGLNVVSYAYGSGFCSVVINGSAENCGANMSASQANKLSVCVVDREAGTAIFYQGADGDSKVGNTIVIPSTTDTVGLQNQYPASQAYIASYGMGVLQFPNGIPADYQDILNYIAAELRADRKGSWITNVDALFPRNQL